MSLRRWLSHCSILALALALCGCEHDCIEVTIEPRPDGSFVRTVRIWRADGAKVDEVLAPTKEVVENAEKCYLDRLAAKAPMVAFQGTFYTLPPDVRHAGDTNHGGYIAVQSRLGAMGCYRERRPGRTDLHTAFKEADAALDTVTKLVVTMVRRELKGEEGLDRLVAFIEGPLRSDVRELAMFAYHEHLGYRGRGEKDWQEHMAAGLAFVVQFGIERGYLEARDVPGLGREEGVQEWLMGLVAKKMGRPLDDPLRRKLAFLIESERREAAAKQAVQDIGLADDKAVEAALKPLGDALLSYDVFGANTRLHFILRCPEGTHVQFTSGRWDKEAKQIEWETVLDESPVADLFFALWSVPDADWQTKRLGRVALVGEALSEYVLWEKSLTPEQAAAWRAALDRLDPKGDLAQQLSDIRVTPAPPDQPPKPEHGADILITALKPPGAK